MVKRNIISTLKFRKDTITFSVMEKIDETDIEIFNATSLIKHISLFLDESLKKIEAKIGGKISSVIAVVEENEKIIYTIEPQTKKIFIPEGIVSSKDVENIISLIKLENKNFNKKIINIQPIDFTIYNKEFKTYLQAPIGKKCSQLEITAFVTRIDANVYNYISEIVKSKNLILSQILLASQEAQHRFLSSQILSNKVVLVNLMSNKVIVSINENFCLKKNFIIYDFGFSNLIAFLTQKFNCSKQEAEKLISIHGNLSSKQEEDIFYDDLNNLKYTNMYLLSVIKSFLSKILISVKKFLRQENVLENPIVVTGKMNNVENLVSFLKQQFSSQNVFLYKGLTLLEKKHENFVPIGIFNFFKAMDKIHSRHYNTIIETRPERISQVLKMKNTKKWYSRFLEILGGKNVWK